MTAPAPVRFGGPLWFGAVLALGAALCPSAAVAQDYMDTTITFIAGDDDLLSGAGETIPSSPNFDFRPRRAQNLFFDNYNQRDTGQETRTHLVLFKAFEGYFDGVTPEAALILEWDANRSASGIDSFLETNSRRMPGGVVDDGSYLWFKFDLSGGDALTLMLFPFNSDRFRLGYSWELTWGGNSSFILARSVPSARLAYESANWYAFGGLKTARTQLFAADPADAGVIDPTEPEENGDAYAGQDENERVFALLAGFGVHLSDHLLAEANGGYFQKGTNPVDRDVLGTRLDQVGASVQVTYHDGIAPSRSAETKRYRNVGDGSLRPLEWDSRPFGWQVAAEATVTSQVLEDADALGTTKRELGYAGDVNLQIEHGQLSYALNLVVRSLEFLVQDTPGLFPFSTVPGELETTPEWFLAGTVSWKLPTPRLVPSLTLGVQNPATARVNGVDPITGERYTADTLVRRTKTVLGNTILEPTPLLRNQDVSPIYSARLQLVAHLSDLLLLKLESQITMNENRLDNDKGIKSIAENPYILGLGFAAQARF